MQDIGQDSPGLKISHDSEQAVGSIADYMRQYVNNNNTLVVCIGTDKCIGDCLAPLVGTLLSKQDFPCKIIGTLDNPVHAINIESVIKRISREYPDHFLLAIDACIGFEDCIGDIQIKHCPIFPGKGVGKNLPHIGDISIVGVVDSFDNSDLFSIRNIRLSFIMRMAETIADALMQATKPPSEKQV